jgi:hypothetical protein
MVEMRTMDAREIIGGQRLIQVEAEYFRADGRIERHDFEWRTRAWGVRARRCVRRK